MTPLFLALAVSALARPTRCAPPIEPAQAQWQGESRIIKFNSKTPVGTLHVLRHDKNGGPLPGLSLGPAVGAVRVPKDGDVALEVSYDGSLYLSWLDALGPNELQGLQFNMTGINDDTLQHLERLSGLKRLDLRDNEISDKGLVHLLPLKKLESLALDRLEVRDEGLKHLSTLTTLRYLSLSHNNLHGDGLKYLRPLKNLRMIDISNTQVTGQGLKYLDQADFADFNAMACKICDTDCAILHNLNVTGLISITQCPVSNAGLRNLGRLPRLKELWCQGTKVDAKGVREFKRLNPHCKVIWEYSADVQEHRKLIKQMTDQIK